MNTNIEEIKKLIMSIESIVRQKEDELYELKTKYCEEVKRKFTEDTGISKGDKFECTITYKLDTGEEYTDKICGLFMGFDFEEQPFVSLFLKYREVGDDNTPPSVSRMYICYSCPYQFRKL